MLIDLTAQQLDIIDCALDMYGWEARKDSSDHAHDGMSSYYSNKWKQVELLKKYLKDKTNAG